MDNRTGKSKVRLVAVLSAVAVLLSGVAGAQAGASESTRHDNPLQRRLNTLVQEDKFPGVTAAVRDRDGRTRHYTAGVGNLAGRTPVPRNGQIRMGSNTKMFTAVVVLQLVGERRISLDDPVEKYLPNVVRAEGVDGRTITIRQLLQHTSGLADYDQKLMSDLFAALHQYYEPRELVDVALGEKPDAAHGQWSYSNTNFILAGLVVQKVTGRPVGEEITNRVINRIGLRDTYWPGVGEQAIRGRHPHGYLAMKRGDAWTDVSESETSAAWAAGALVGTPVDLNTFMTALVTGKLLEPEQLKEMQKTIPSPGFDLTGQARYGLGLATFALSCGGFAWTHGGLAVGYSTYNAVTPDGKAATIGITGLPRDVTDLRHMEAALDTALCT
ncbi:serine hydrolase [Kibdelosporangium persicum]|uniref:Serine-type D-Ala-D-Ala carboxypeptidase n=1 Tax=Kibdelosporangium persicum TaxID=2698649 RepID=A0ABX2F6N3_9PSEU|nr:serine hydrolase domain-containing protein [Kibdelosporangium persicum]NRN66450.1 Serine-type D-Ala-D-Ala carboxypeptidase [Kibdelosporangium persicum]